MKHYSWAIIWAIVILLLCCMPMDSTGGIPKFPGIDKLVHTGFFFVLTVLLFYGAIRRSGEVKASWRVFIRVFVMALMFALFTEYLQWKIFTYRSAESWDFFADMVGTGMGIFAYLILYRANPSRFTATDRQLHLEKKEHHVQS